MWLIVFLVFLFSDSRKVFIAVFALACLTQCYAEYLNHNLRVRNQETLEKITTQIGEIGNVKSENITSLTE